MVLNWGGFDEAGTLDVDVNDDGRSPDGEPRAEGCRDRAGPVDVALDVSVSSVDGGNVKVVKDDDDERRKEGGCRGAVGPVENGFVDMPVSILDGDAESQGPNDADRVWETPSERLVEASIPVSIDDVVVLLEQTELKTGSR